MLPEQALWFEVIYLALQDFAGTTRESRVRVNCQRAAHDWFFSAACGTGSFLFCCEALDLDPAAVRRALRNVDPETLRTSAAIRTNFIDRPFTDALDNPRFDCFPGIRVSSEIFR